MTKIKAAQPDFIYIPGYYQEVGLIVKQAREMGITVPMAGGDGWDSAKLPEIAGKAALENTFFSSLYSPDDTSDLNKEFVAEYKKLTTPTRMYLQHWHMIPLCWLQSNRRCRQCRSG